MYIKRLEIVGFKSFPERAVVPLGPGISAVVGPNGCGKSNIIDAIRWVMGEQSPRLLRGRNMDDVLFNGSLGRPASALAEVTLTLAKDKDPNQSQSFAAESSVTRRLYRSGDSEYLINRVPCRLKDVIRFFTDQGVGTRAYGIIEQGRVGWLVDARPEERRNLIDEAAGITRYKQQKKEAERKIEAAEANLVNVSVIKAETKKQLDQITRAAARAARYKALKEELRELDLILSAQSLTEARSRRRELLIGREENRRLLAALLAEGQSRELELDNIRTSEERGSLELEEKNRLWHSLSAQHDSLRQEIKFGAENLERTGQLRAEILDELARLNSERRRKLEQQLEAQRQLAELQLAEAQTRQLSEETRSQLHSRQAVQGDLRAQLEKAESRGVQAERRAAALSASLAGDERLLAHHRDRLEELGEGLQRTQAARAEAAERAELARRNRAQAEEFLAELRQSAAEALVRRREVEAQAAEAEAQVQAAASSLTALQARCEALAELKDSFGWYPSGVKALMEAPELEGLLGPLAEHLSIDDGFEAAVEAALGERLAWLVAEDRACALKAVDYLREHKLGRCGFVLRSELAASGGDLARALLGDFRLAETLTEAGGEAEALVTRQGLYVGRGLVVGGSAGSSETEAGPLARLKALEQLQAQAEAQSERLESLRAQAHRARQQAQESLEAARVAESAAAKASAELSQLEREQAVAETSRDQASARYDELVRQTQQSQVEAERLADALSRGLQERSQAAAEAESQAQLAGTLKGRLADLAEELETLRFNGQEAAEAATRATAALERCRQNLDNTGQWLAGVEDNLAAKDAQLARLAQEAQEAQERLELKRSQEAEFPQRLSEAEAQQALARQALDEWRRRRQSLENQARELRRRREDLAALINGQETDLMAVNFTLEKLEEELWRAWRVTMPDPDKEPQPPQEAVAESPAAGFEAAPPKVGEASEPEDGAAETEAPAGEELSAELWAARPLPPEAQGRRESLKNKIAALGEVSLAAIERESELKAEYQRYQRQYDDLSQAIADLRGSIEKINYTCKCLFAETFRAVDEKFRDIFPILFEGGEGWLSLTDEADPLESGVEIHVHPPGKKLLVMSLLSGGEKALTALALIFALYLIKPSPFCLLDETDAPLDEANIDRFNRLLNRLSQASQIIMVTHNKRTMQISRTLYGVTMETPGVSKLVSVNLAEAEALSADV